MVGEIGGSGLLGSSEYDLSAGSDPKAAVCWLVERGPEQATSGLTLDEHRSKAGLVPPRRCKTARPIRAVWPIGRHFTPLTSDRIAAVLIVTVMTRARSRRSRYS